MPSSAQTHKPLDFAGRRVWIAGHSGMVGAALLRKLAPEGAEILTAGHGELDLCRQRETEDWLAAHKPEFIFLAAARVGSIHANATYPAQFLYDNLMIETNIIEGAHKVGVKKLLVLGSSCIYPRMAPQPMPESCLLTGPLEETNQWYAIAKIAGIKLAQAYRRQYGLNFVSVMPTNLYGPADNYHPENGHVVAALIRRIHEAKIAGKDRVVIWGTGTPRREFLHVDDLASACLFLMKNFDDEEPINIGSGQEVTIAELAKLIAETVGWSGQIEFDPKKPDGTPRKLLDASRLSAMGWKPTIGLCDGLANAYADFMLRWQRGEFAGRESA